MSNLLLTFKLTVFSVKAAWGLTKAMFAIIFLPVIIFGLAAGGLFVLAVPLLVIALLGVFLVPLFKIVF